jgi:uncharacterized protein
VYQSKRMSDWTLITGASSGIGLELAKVFAGHGRNLVLLARNQVRLEQLAAELRATHRIETMVLSKDLAQPNAGAEVFEALSDTPISELVNNAGFGSAGPFAASDLPSQTALMRTNMEALVQLTHFFLPPMLARRRGRILNVASLAAFQPGPFVSVYYASKAFVFSFSYALAAELKDSGVSATVLCPGGTRTEFFNRARMPIRGWAMMDARTVAEIGYRGMIKGKRVVIPGLMNKLAAFLSKRFPPRITAGVVRRVHPQP